MAKLLVGGASHRRSSSERFRYRLDVLLDLYDVETALQEIRTEVWYMVTCATCENFFPVKFDRDAERAEWARDHVTATGHIVIRFEEPR